MRRLLLTFFLFVASSLYGQARETIDVVRILLDARVTRFSGEPVLGLDVGDFDVRIGGRPAKVESVRWVDESSGIAIPPDPSSDPTAAQEVDRKRGRLLVVFIQTDFVREPSRVAGQLHFLKYANDLVDSFAAEDRVAVFSFDSHLKFRLDFTSDKERVKEQLRAAIRIDNPPSPPIVPAPALAPHLDREQMQQAGNPERALMLVGEALRALEGPKTLLLMGWGLGVRSGGRVRMRPQWKVAQHALDAARTTVFAFDTTVADYHDLEVGLITAAEETGGFYAKTHLFPQTAIERLQRTLSGHYELELRRPEDLERGTHALIVKVKQRALVMAPQSYRDR